MHGARLGPDHNIGCGMHVIIYIIYIYIYIYNISNNILYMTHTRDLFFTGVMHPMMHLVIDHICYDTKIK